MEFSRQESWSGLPFASPGALLDPGMEPRSPTLQADALLSHQGSPIQSRLQILVKMRRSLHIFQGGAGGGGLQPSKGPLGAR